MIGIGSGGARVGAGLGHECGERGGCGVPVATVQAFDNRRQFIVRPDGIRPGDWLRDLGTLRQVESVEAVAAGHGLRRLFVVRFVPIPGVEDLVLSIPDTVTVTIWRPA